MSTSDKAPDPLFVFRGARSPVMSITFLKNLDDDLQYIAAGTQEGQVLIWDLKTKCLVKEWAAHPESSVLWLYSQSPGELWTLGRHDRVTLWDISQPVSKVLQHFPLQDYLGFSHCDVASGRDGKLLLAIPGPSQEGITIFDIQHCSSLGNLTPCDPKKYGTLMQVKWVYRPENINLLATYESGIIVLWNYITHSVVSEVRCGETPICFAYDPNSCKGMIGTASEKVFKFCIDDNLKINIEREICITNPGLASCAIRSDGKIFLAGGWDYRIRLFSCKKMKPLAVLLYHKKTIECLSYAPKYVKYFECQYLFAAGSSDMSVSIWKLYDS